MTPDTYTLAVLGTVQLTLWLVAALVTVLRLSGNPPPHWSAVLVVVFASALPTRWQVDGALDTIERSKMTRFEQMEHEAQRRFEVVRDQEKRLGEERVELADQRIRLKQVMSARKRASEACGADLAFLEYDWEFEKYLKRRDVDVRCHGAAIDLRWYVLGKP